MFTAPTNTRNIERVFSNFEAKLFCFWENLVTNIVRIKAEYFTTIITFHMFMMMFLAAFYFIFFLIISEINFSNNSNFTKEFHASKNTCSTDFRERLYKIFTLEKVLFLHIRKEFYSLWSDFHIMFSQNFFYFHKWDWVSINNRDYI